MKSRLLMACLFLAAFTLAFATLITTLRVNGSGRAVDASGRYAYFTVDCKKVIHDGASTLQGTFDLNMPLSTTDSIRVHLNTLQFMNIFENHGSMAGPGVLRIQHGYDVRYFPGRLYVIGTSNRHPGEAGDPDTIFVDFRPDVNTNPTFHFEGVLTYGDVAVTTTLSY